jgi:hypothetical protein
MRDYGCRVRAILAMRAERAEILLGFGSEHTEGVSRGTGFSGYEHLGMW